MEDQKNAEKAPHTSVKDGRQANIPGVDKESNA